MMQLRTHRAGPLSLSILLLFAIAGVAGCTHPRVECAAAERTMRNKVYAGYQGWFSTPGDGSGISFDNYRVEIEGEFVFRPGAAAIDLWPDLSEFDDDEKYATQFRHADGSVAHVFSSANAKTVNRHFQWMKEYGIDGVFLQRFAWVLDKPIEKGHRDTVMRHVRQSAEKHDREWAVMYDLTAVSKGFIREHVIPDFKRIVDEGDPRPAAHYIHSDGKPVVAIWGIGFADGRGYSLEECLELVRFLKDDPVYGGNAVMLGVPYHWRSRDRDAVDDPVFDELLKACDIISPWSVGRYTSPDEADRIVGETVQADQQWADEHAVDYLPVVFPGFSWQNLERFKGRDAELGAIPRLGGEFLWRQAVAAKSAGASMVYVAMFDELNEGTAIMKCTNDPPVGESRFLTYGEQPSDHYLWLSGQIGRLLRDELPIEPTLPARSR